MLRVTRNAKIDRLVIGCCLYLASLGAPLFAAEGTGLTALYFSNQDFTGTMVKEIDPTINFNWGANGPGLPGIGPTRFSAVWFGSVKAQFNETYTFYTESDDGVALWVNGQLLVNNFTLHAVTENSGTITLVAGQSYEIVMKYFQYKGLAQAGLLWSSPSTPKAVVPQNALYPTVAPDSLSITTPAASRTSPAWLEGTSSAANDGITVTANGASSVVTREGMDTWFASSSTAGQPLGIPLNPASGASVAIVATEGTHSVTTKLAWTLTDLASLPYGMKTLTIRPGDQLLFATGGTGTKTEIDTNFNGVTFHAVLTGTPTSRFPTSFTTPGTFDVRAHRDGIEVGKLTVIVASVNFAGPIADEIGYQRIKEISVLPSAAIPGLTFTSNDPMSLIVSVASISATGPSLSLLPLAPWNSVIQARIGGLTGPVLAQQHIDVFSLQDSGETNVQLIQGYPDGSLLTQAALTMSPLVKNLDIAMTIFISGVTFSDSSLTLTTSSNAFTSSGSAGTFNYQMIQAPGGYYHLCHTLQVFQSGVPISP